MVEEALLRSSLSNLREEPDRLIEIVVQQAKLIDELRAEIERLKKDRDEMNRRLEQLEREAKRQVAPFRIADRKRSANPGKPGRPPGHRGVYRVRPDPMDEFIEVPLPSCPTCGGEVHDVQPVEQFIEDLPPVRPHVTHLVTYRGRCAQCGEVRSTHPRQVSTATDAAGTHLGPRALGVALQLTHQYGLTRRTVCRILRELFGLRLSPGGLVQAAHRLARNLQVRYDRLIEQLRLMPAVYADETSWWVGGPKWWLWVFTHPLATVYRVAQGRGRCVVIETLGADYGGVLVSDCLASYEDATARQHKCYAHHLKAIAQAIEQHPHGGQGFLQDLQALLRAAIALKNEKHTLQAAPFLARRRQLESAARQWLGPPRADPLEGRVANRLRKQLDHLFTCLDDDAVDPTNNLAERQLRPAVISRKLSCGNRTERGARTWEILASLAATCSQGAQSFATLIAHAARLPPSPQKAR